MLDSARSLITETDYFLGFFFVLDMVSTFTLLLDLTWVWVSVEALASEEIGIIDDNCAYFCIFLEFKISVFIMSSLAVSDCHSNWCGVADGSQVNDALAGGGDSSSLRSGRCAPWWIDVDRPPSGDPWVHEHRCSGLHGLVRRPPG